MSLRWLLTTVAETVPHRVISHAHIPAVIKRGILRFLAVGIVSIVPTISQAQTISTGYSSFAIGRDLDQHLRSIRDRSLAVVAVAAELPAATAQASATLVTGDGSTGSGFVLRLLLLWLGGWLAELLFRRWSTVWIRRIVESPLASVRQRLVAQVQRLLFAQCLVLSFAVGSCLTYLAVAPPAAAGVMALDVLLAIVAVRSARVLGRFLFAPGGPRLRLVALTTTAAWRAQHGITAVSASVAAGLLWSAFLRLAGVDATVADAATNLGLLLAAILVPAAVGTVIMTARRSRDRPVRPAAVALALVPIAAWLLAQAGLPAAAWTTFVLGLAPALALALGDAARTVAFGPNRSGLLTREERIVAHAARNVALIVALLLVAEGAPGSGGGLGVSATTEIVSALLILLVADLAWQVARSLIDRGLVSSDGDPRTDRLATVLPALRTVVLVALAVTAALSIASTFGLQIGPLLAGAGVVGLTIGFGAQALVRDVIAGFFLLLDDAFRVGETIESSSLQGRVESFSLRSVRLRDDSGHMHTVAFGELKAVTNFSRDWAGVEVPVYVPHGVSFDAAAAVIAGAIEAIEADEAFTSILTGPVQFLGPTALSETSVRLAVLIRTVPGSQGRVRSELLRRVLSGMAEAGIALAS